MVRSLKFWWQGWNLASHQRLATFNNFIHRLPAQIPTTSTFLLQVSTTSIFLLQISTASIFFPTIFSRLTTELV
jgi:hypothetical protein